MAKNRVDFSNVHSYRGVMSVSDATIVIEEREQYLYLRFVGGFLREDVIRVTHQAAAVIRQPGKQWRVITDFREGKIQERGVDTILSEYSTANRPFIERSAVLGLGGLTKTFFTLFLQPSDRDDITVFNTLEDAETWILDT